jgi:predicted nuclease of predicted toxin-antitoxin system
MAPWIKSQFGVECLHVRTLGLRDKEDLAIYQEARLAGAVIVSKDRDFTELSKRLGPPPQILLVTCGNTSNQRLQEIFKSALGDALDFLKAGEPIVEISDSV